MRIGFSIAILSLILASSAFAWKLDLAEVAKATIKYADVDIARADGYIPLPGQGCITAASLGAEPSLGNLGVLFVHPERLKLYHVGGRIMTSQAWTNWVEPGVLIYEPTAAGGLVLVGIANIVSPQGWAGNGFVTEPITEGQVWPLVMDDPATEIDEAYGMVPHFTLRIWLFRENPSGSYGEFNKAVSCDPDKKSLN